MKTLIFNGSPRKSGDTVSLINKMTENLYGEYLIIHAYESGIQPCIDCRYCWENEGCCIDDRMQDVYKYIEESDNILIASPIYFSDNNRPAIDDQVALEGVGNHRFWWYGKWHAQNAPRAGVEIVAVCDIVKEKQDEAIEMGFKLYKSAEELLEDTEVNTVILTVPNYLHKEMCLKAAAAGKNVIAEKPAAMNVKELDEMETACKDSGVLFTVHQNRRWDKDMLLVKKAYDEGLLGNIFTMESKLHSANGYMHEWHLYKNVEDNLEIVKEVWPPIVKYAEEKGVKIAIENCPMLFTNDEWPGGQNIMTSPANWRKVFKLIDSTYFGINYDPSHFVWQQIDYIKPLYEFKDKIFHVHYKDIKVFPDKLADVGVMATPLEYMSPKLPGLGDVDWGKYVSALSDIGFKGYTCIEVEDKAFEGSIEEAKKAVALSAKYLRNYVI